MTASAPGVLTPLLPADWPSSLHEVLADTKGRPLNVHGLMANHPDLLSAWWPFRNHTVTGGTLAARERELVILAVARHLRNDYEWQSHVDRGLAAGLTAEEIERIRTGGGDWDVKDALLLEAVHGLLTAHEVPEECLGRMRQCFSPDQLMDIMFIHGAYVILGCLLNTFAVPLDDDVAARLRAAGLDDESLRVSGDRTGSGRGEN